MPNTKNDKVATLPFRSKMPSVETSIFAVMSGLAKKEGAINLSQGFPNFSCDEKLIELINKYMKAGYNQYAPMPGVPALRKRIAEKVDRVYGKTIDPEGEITVTAGATQALFTAIAAVVQKGDEVIIIEPAYDSYKPAIELNGGVVVPYELSLPDFKINWDELSRLVTERTRMIMINNPHNPCGTIFGPQDLEALDDLTRNTGIIVLSDEVYEHLVFDGATHESVLKYPDLYNRSILTFSFGKTFHATGWKMGYALAPSHLTEEFRKVHQFNVFSVNTPIQYALAEYMADPSTYEDLSDFYQEKRDLFNEAMSGSRLRPIPCKGTYFQLFDYRDVSDLPDREFANYLTREYGVAAIPISVFYTSKRDDRVLRFCFAKKAGTLKEAGTLLSKV